MILKQFTLRNLMAFISKDRFTGKLYGKCENEMKYGGLQNAEPKCQTENSPKQAINHCERQQDFPLSNNTRDGVFNHCEQM